MFVLERSGVGLLDLLNNLGDPIRSKKRRAFKPFDLSHLFGDLRTLIQKSQQLQIQRVNPDA